MVSNPPFRLVHHDTQPRELMRARRINYPNQVSPPHLFTFFTTDGYQSTANNKGGWNRDVAGWVQVDTQIFPGTTFAPLSTRGGAQYDVKIQWLLDGANNWWLFVLDRWIGYYPGTLFSAGTDAGRSLQSGAVCGPTHRGISGCELLTWDLVI
jgi:hypothetical protein